MSLAEAIAGRVPGTRVVTAFPMCQARVGAMDPPVFDGRRLVTLPCGDDAGAKRTVAGLIEAVGSEPVGLGELRYARLLAAAAGVVIAPRVGGRDPRTALNRIQAEVRGIG